VIDLAGVELVEPLAEIGVRAFTTTRTTADFRIADEGPDPQSTAVWHGLLAALGPTVQRLVSSRQVHGDQVHWHEAPPLGWQRIAQGDGHVSGAAGTALAVSVADCIPIFVAHPAGVVGVLHAGWRGVAAQILGRAVRQLEGQGLAAADLYVHCGPAISGRAYEVGPPVYEALTGWETARPRCVDLRALVAEQARSLGVRRLSMSSSCTVEDNARFFSHRRGDSGRQVAVVVVPSA
jgi:YfiH family protein